MNTRQTQTEGGQYCINIKGCTRASFRAIRSKPEEELIQEMLSAQDVVNKHPRGHEGCINAVAALKPYWEEREGVFNWAKF